MKRLEPTWGTNEASQSADSWAPWPLFLFLNPSRRRPLCHWREFSLLEERRWYGVDATPVKLAMPSMWFSRISFSSVANLVHPDLQRYGRKQQNPDKDPLSTTACGVITKKVFSESCFKELKKTHRCPPICFCPTATLIKRLYLLDGQSPDVANFLSQDAMPDSGLT